MVPKPNFTDHAQYSAILETYPPGIQAMFTLAAETPEWWLLPTKEMSAAAFIRQARLRVDVAKWDGERGAVRAIIEA